MTQRHRAWADRIFTTVLVAGTGFVSNLLANAPTVDTLTAVRIIGHLEVSPDSTSESEGSVTVDIGIGVASTEAVLIGVTALPDPTQEDEYPPRGWIYVARRRQSQSLPTGGTPTAMWRQDAIFDFDVRAMRKIDKGVLFMFVETNTIDGAGSTRIVGRVRTLCLT